MSSFLPFGKPAEPLPSDVNASVAVLAAKVDRIYTISVLTLILVAVLLVALFV